MNSNQKLSLPVIEKLSQIIKEANGNEVFAMGKINSEGIVISVEIGARGHETAVTVNNEIVKGGNVLIHNHPSGVLQPSDADMIIASRAADNAQGFYIINNDVSSVYAVVEPIKPKKTKLLDSESVAAFISDGGPLSGLDDFFEERPSQIQLLKKICSVFNENKIGVFEAGTGVGKSFAYLIPVLQWVANNDERVVISTGTINLQQQLAEKDVPLAEKITGISVKYILLKGRQNYVCRRRLADILDEKDLFTEESDELDKIYSWVKTSETGSKSDLSFVPSESLWQRICSESDACMGMKCPFHESCFVMRLRKEAADAKILIVNHHLLFADIEMRLSGVGYDDVAVLPPYKRLVFDEAHGMEDAATSFFSESITRFKFIKQLNLLYRQRRKASAGLLFTLDVLSNADVDMTEVVVAIDSVKKAIELLEEQGLELLGNSFSWRLNNQTELSATDMLLAMGKLRIAISECTGLIRSVIEGIDEKDEDAPQVWEAKQILRRIEMAGTLCKNFVEWKEREDTVFWIDKRRTSTTIFPCFIQTPLEIASTMNAGVFEPMESVVCASATLQIASDFTFWKKRAGVLFVEKNKVVTGEFSSPFSYSSNLLLAIPVDAPAPNNQNFQPWIENAIVRLILASQGRCLVLFTSYDSLKYAWEYARSSLVSQGITVLKQGDDDRFRLLEQFKKDTSSVLFATNSFWEGVDVPGQSLSHVIIVKLPFAVPSDPVFSARSEDIERRNGNSFMELSIPDSVMHFRQGFGRLLRRSTDKGIVTVLDNRLIQKSYGRIFIDSIPETKKAFKPLEEITREIALFLE